MIRCTHCDREVPPDDRIPLDEPGEILCLSCDDRLKEELEDFCQLEEELNDFTSNH